MELALQGSGFEVFNLRTCNRPQHFSEAAIEVNAHAVFVSSINGEGEYWCANFRGHFEPLGLSDLILYVGGNLIVGNRPEHEVIALFRGYGFDRVYHRHADIETAIADLERDLEHGSPER